MRRASRSQRTRTWEMWLAASLAAIALLAACTAPIGRLPAYQGTYLQNALVTNPNSNGPHVVIWGPPQNYNPAGQE